MFARLLPLVLVGCVVPAFAQAPKPIKPAVVKADAPEPVKAYFRRANEARPALARYFEKSIARGRVTLRENPGFTAEEIRVRNSFIDFDLRKLEIVVNRLDAPIPIGQELVVGAIGTVRSASVRRVIDANRAVVDLTTKTQTYTVDTITESSPRMHTVLLEMPTDGWETDKRLEMEGFFEVTGTGLFELRPGVTKDLFVLKPVDVKKYLVEAP